MQRCTLPLLLAGLVALLAGPARAEDPPAPARPGTTEPAAGGASAGVAVAPLQDWELEALGRLELLENLELLEELDVVEDLGVLDGSGGEP